MRIHHAQIPSRARERLDRVWAALRDVFLIRPAADPSPSLLLWICLGLLSAVLATAVAGRPGQLLDLWLLRDWLAHWRDHGNPYVAFDNLDYPPNAFLVLWPLSLASDNVAAVIMPPLMVMASAAAALVLLQSFAERLGIRLRWQEQTALVAMVLAGSSVRGAIWRGQTAPLSFLFGALALHWAARRPWLAALALSLCAFKPHVAIGFALVIALTKRRDVVIYAAALAAAQNALFAATVDAPLSDLLLRYVQILATMYDGPDALPGMLSIRWVLEGFIGNHRLATLAYITLAVSALVIIVSAAMRRRDPVTLVHVAAASLLWSLAFLPHQLYNGVLSIPAIWLLMWPESGLLSSDRRRVLVVGALVLFRVMDVPRALRLAAGYWAWPWLVENSYPLQALIVACLLTLFLWTLTRRVYRATA
ncbi:MAG: glycosyltransferase 87 family protein [Cyanobacteria bacterium]|nr:glycosyltransferase 87 family protein [Cyanobacteriota bacterium]